MDYGFDLLFLKKAYTRLKSYAYYDTSSYVLRELIVKFEEKNVDKSLEEIFLLIQDEEYINNLIEKNIKIVVIPKDILNEKADDILTNIPKEKILLSKVDYIIELPIELHLLSMVWILKYGEILDNQLSTSVYSYRLRLLDETNRNIFKSYHRQHSKWVDGGIDSIENTLESEENVIYFYMDIKEYYYSINMESFENGFINIYKTLLNSDRVLNKEECTNLTKIIELICVSYSKKLIREQRVILPLGFIPSNILSNWYLRKFDSYLINTVNPLYYGRYVDDILIVIKDIDTKEALDKINIINEYLCKSKVLRKKDEELYSIASNIEYKNLNIELKKIKIGVLDYRYSKLNFTNHLKELCRQDKYQLSANNFQEEYSKELDKDIEYMFTGSKAIENFRLWENIFTYYSINNKWDKLQQMVESILETIDKLKYSSSLTSYRTRANNETIQRRVKGYLNKNVKIALAMTIALDSKFIKKYKKTIGKTIKIEKVYLEHVVISNMIRHNYIVMPLINYCEVDLKNYSFIQFNKMYPEKSELVEEKLKYSPRYVYFHEYTMYNFLKSFDIGKEKFQGDYLKKSRKLFIEDADEEDLFTIKEKDIGYSGIDDEIEHGKRVNIINIDSFSTKSKFKVGLANIVISETTIQEAIKNDNSDIKSIVKSIKNILNEGIRYKDNKVDFIVFPEACIPLEAIEFIADYCRKNEIVVIGGVRHFTINNKNKNMYNMLVTILPTKYRGYNSAIIKFRLKNYYAPNEENLIDGYGYNIPHISKPSYDLFTWKGIKFSCYNCFELASIEDRSIFKSHIDLMFASVYNKDTKYYSKIIDTISREIHCYVAQANTAQYGDLRIARPSSTNYQDILRVKGGENSKLLIGEIDINQLREFQIKGYGLQLEEGTKRFKPVPPDFRRDVVMEKIRKK